MNQISHPLFGMSGREPPSNMEAEQALLGAILANNKAYDNVSHLLLPEHFAYAAHQRIYEVASAVIQSGNLADAVTLKAKFTEDGTLGEVGGTAYLAHLLGRMVSINGAADYARVIHDIWLRRQVIAVGSDAVSRAFDNDPDLSGEELLDEVSGSLSSLAVNGSRKVGGSSLTASVRAAIQEGEDAASGLLTRSVSSGIPSLDKCMLRLRSGRLYVIGGRPGMGKSIMARSVAMNVALGQRWTEDGQLQDDQSFGWGVGYSAMEESDVDFGTAALSQLTGISTEFIASGVAARNMKMAEKLVLAERRLAKADHLIEIFDEPGQSLRTIRHNAIHLQRKMHGKLRLYVVDYLQLMQDPPGIKDKRIAVSENVRGLKNLAKELQITVLALSQLGRQVDDRSDRRPTPRDLMEAGEIEASADVIMFPYREAHYHGQTKPKFDPTEPPGAYQARLAAWQQEHDGIAQVAEVNFPKVRGGPAHVFCNLKFNGLSSRFEEQGI